MKRTKDEEYIRRCFALARKGERRVSPNPMVGAVIVKNGKIIGEGCHEYFGGPHAEVNAFNNCSEDPEGADVYVNLEPCSHVNKKTPPCAPLVISKKIKRLIISNLDLNPEVNGNGVKMISEAGIEVVTGILENEGNELNKFFFKFAKEGIPYVTLKIAASADGFIAKERGKQTWITGKEAKVYVHKLRAKYETVLVGANTINADDPQLSVRECKGMNPARIILDAKLSVRSDAKALLTADRQRTIIITSEEGDKRKKEKLIETGAEIIELPAERNGRINLLSALKEIGRLNLSSVLVEGGADIFTQFVVAKLTDEIHLIKAPIKLGSGVNAFNENISLNSPAETSMLGEDTLFVYKNL